MTTAQIIVVIFWVVVYVVWTSLTFIPKFNKRFSKSDLAMSRLLWCVSIVVMIVTIGAVIFD